MPETSTQNHTNVLHHWQQSGECIFLAYLTNKVYIYAYFVHFLTHAQPAASPVAGCSCTIPASPTTTGSGALFMAHKLMP